MGAMQRDNRASMSSRVRPLAVAAGLLVVSLAAAGCGDNLGEPLPPPDALAPVAPDAMAVDANPGAMGVCEAPIAATGALGSTVMATGDTSMVTPGLELVELGAGCGPDIDPAPPQQVVAYAVPGTGRVGIELSLVNDDTLANFDTLVEIRTACGEAPAQLAGTCFNDVRRSEPRSRGAVFASGGDTIYLVVTGDGEPDQGRVSEGPWKLELYAETATTPALTGGALRIRQTYLEGTVTGTDAGSDAREVRLVFYRADGTIVDIDADGDGEQSDRLIFPLEGVSGQAAFTGTLQVDAFGLFMRQEGAVAADVSLLDRFGDESERVRIDIAQPELRGVGQSCDDVTTFCAVDLACEGSVCTVPESVRDACDAATAVAIATPGDTATVEVVAATLQPGTGALTATCVETTGTEQIFTVAVPAGGPYDLIAHTDLEATGDIDTLVYVRSSCQDPTTEAACNDDGEDIAPHSRVEVLTAPAGSYTIIVEPYPFSFDPLPAEVGLAVMLRPVLASGATCDPAGAENRCAGEPCDEGTCP
jgi:hypothetical protein